MGSALRTFLAVLAWIALNEFVPKTDKDGLNALRVLGGAAVATLAVYLAVVLLQWRPLLHLHAELLHDPTSPVGRRVDASPFPAPLVGESVWFLIYVEYIRRGPVAALIARGMSNTSNRLELAFQPSTGLLVNPEKANGADVIPLAQGKRGVAIALPSPPSRGRFAAFQVELKPVTVPVPLPLVANVSLVRGPGKARRRLALVKTSSDIKEVQVLS